jgi:hypothetical protein
MDKPDIIKKAMQTEMDRRLDLMREYLLMQEKMTPLAALEYNVLMAKALEYKVLMAKIMKGKP